MSFQDVIDKIPGDMENIEIVKKINIIIEKIKYRMKAVDKKS